MSVSLTLSHLLPVFSFPVIISSSQAAHCLRPQTSLSSGRPCLLPQALLSLGWFICRSSELDECVGMSCISERACKVRVFMKGGRESLGEHWKKQVSATNLKAEKGAMLISSILFIYE